MNVVQQFDCNKYVRTYCHVHARKYRLKTRLLMLFVRLYNLTTI